MGWKHFSVYQRQHFQISPDMFAKYLGVETYLWDVYKTQNFQFYPKIRAKHLWGGNIFLAYPDSHAKHLGGINIFLGCV